MIVHGLVVAAFALGGLLAPPAGALPVATGTRASAAVPSITAGVSPLAVIRARASVSGFTTRLKSGKVRVSVSSNAKKVKLTYRNAKNRKRSATITIRSGVGARTLPKGSKRIYARAIATKKLRESRRMAVPPKGGNTTTPPSTGSGFGVHIDPIEPAVGVGDGGIVPTYFRLSGPSGIAPAGTGFVCPAPVSAANNVYVADRRSISPGRTLKSGWFEPVRPGGVFAVFDTSPSSSEVLGDYLWLIRCEEREPGTDFTLGPIRVLRQWEATISITEPARTVQVSTPTFTTGQSVTISDGGGCGTYPGSTEQRVTVGIQVPNGSGGWRGDAVANTQNLDGTGRWVPVTLTVPANPYPELGFRVGADCVGPSPEANVVFHDNGDVTFDKVGDWSAYYYADLPVPFAGL